jgi:hypothetical protein
MWHKPVAVGRRVVGVGADGKQLFAAIYGLVAKGLDVFIAFGGL